MQNLLHELIMAAENENWLEYNILLKKADSPIIVDQFEFAILNNNLSQRLRQPEIL